jgi:hypothetical protein
MKDVSDGWGAGYGKHKNSGVGLNELTEAREPLVMATERSESITRSHDRQALVHPVIL